MGKLAELNKGYPGKLNLADSFKELKGQSYLTREERNKIMRGRMKSRSNESGNY